VTTPAPDYDDVVGRTRQSWLRTSLGSAAVILLVERGLVVSSSPLWSRWLGLLPAVLLLGVALMRMRELGRDGSGHSLRPTVLVFLAASVGLVAVALVSVVVTDP
jgi:hypothetical protein